LSPDRNTTHVEAERAGKEAMTYSIDGIRPETRAAIEAVEHRLELARSGVGEQDITSKNSRDLATATDIGVEDVARSIVGMPFRVPIVARSGVATHLSMGRHTGY
jgi:hypothetical protein